MYKDMLIENTEFLCDMLSDPDSKLSYPEIYDFLGEDNVPIVEFILKRLVATSYVDMELDEIRYLSFVGTQSITIDISQEFKRDISKSHVIILLNKLAYLNVIEKIPDEDIPSWLFILIKKHQVENNYMMHTSVYNVAHINEDIFYGIWDLSKDIVTKGLPTNGFSYKYVSRMFGSDISNRIFPQLAEKGMVTDYPDMVNYVSKYLMDKVEKYGYVVEKDLKVAMKRNKKYTHQFSDYTWKQMRDYVLLDGGLTSSRATNILRKRLGVTNSKITSNTVIILPKDNIERYS